MRVGISLLFMSMKEISKRHWSKCKKWLNLIQTMSLSRVDLNFLRQEKPPHNFHNRLKKERFLQQPLKRAKSLKPFLKKRLMKNLMQRKRQNKSIDQKTPQQIVGVFYIFYEKIIFDKSSFSACMSVLLRKHIRASSRVPEGL